METDQPDSHRFSRIYSYRLSHTSGVVTLAGLLAVAVGGYLFYQNSSSLDASSELQPKPVSSSPDTEGATSPSGAADAASKLGSQQVAADANAPAENPPNQGSQTPLPSLDSWRAGTQPQGLADDRAAPTNSDNATEPAAGLPENARSRPTSLPTNDIAYVQKARANIRAEPSVGAKLVGQADRGSKLTVVGRAGKWTEVERGATRGWVSANLLGPRSP
jgi:uncharacterized protein YgiM (DUF1202 family)